MDNLIDKIDDLLPQTQCEQCGYAGCRPYAEAIARGEAHNKCPPGGDALQEKLAKLLKRESVPLNIPGDSQPGKRLEAVIREDECIGCTKCIQACPVDAIVGAPQLMHTVISHECTGCELCVEPCPVDCIDMVLRPAAQQELTQDMAWHARDRYQARNERLEKQAAEKRARRRRRLDQRTSDDSERFFVETPESDLEQLRADYQKTRHQYKQLQGAIDHLKRHGQQPAEQHLAQQAALAADLTNLEQALEEAKATFASSANQDIEQLKLRATRSELAWRRAKNRKVAQKRLKKLAQQRNEDQANLRAAIQGASSMTDRIDSIS